jgi:inner membrane protein
MPTVMSHAVAAWALGTAFRRPGWPARVWWAGAGCAVLPDADVLGLWLGVPFGSMLGHRGLTHSLAFAMALAAIVAPVVAPRGVRVRAALYLFLATASHGVLDAMTDGGTGIAFFAPVDDGRYFLPWRPIPVSPIGLSRFFGPRGAAVIQAEVWLIWLPALVLALTVAVSRRR